VGAADVSVVVLVPGLGDEVQAMKAGIMEIADVFVVNKADREGVDRVVAEIESMLSLAHGHRPAIVTTVASEDRGVDEVLKEVEAFRVVAGASGLLERKRRAHLRQQFEDSVGQRLLRAAWSRFSAEEREATLERLARRELDPIRAAEAVLQKMGLS